MGIFSEFVKNKIQPVIPAMQTPQQPQQQETPQVDTGDAINSIASLIGPSPAEREAQQQKLLKQKRTMLAWTGLFDGLRQLANLYSVSRGANNMQFTDNPYQTIEKGYQAELTRQDANQRYANAYAKQQMDYKRQAVSDQMKRDLQKAQLKWYDTRGETARRNQELAEFKAKTDADYKKATLDQKNAINEVRIRLLEGQINKVEADRQYRLIMMGNAQKGTEKTVTKPDGSVTTTITKPAGSSGNSSKGGKYSRFRKNASKGGSGSSGKFDQYKVNKK